MLHSNYIEGCLVSPAFTATCMYIGLPCKREILPWDWVYRTTKTARKAKRVIIKERRWAIMKCICKQAIVMTLLVSCLFKYGG